MCVVGTFLRAYPAEKVCKIIFCGALRKQTYPCILPNFTQISDLLQGQDLSPRSDTPANSSRGSGSPIGGLNALEGGLNILLAIKSFIFHASD